MQASSSRSFLSFAATFCIIYLEPVSDFHFVSLAADLVILNAVDFIDLIDNTENRTANYKSSNLYYAYYTQLNKLHSLTERDTKFRANLA